MFSPCVTYNLDNTYPRFKQRVKKLEDDSSYDSTNWTDAMGKSEIWGEEIPIGKFVQRTDLPALHQAEPILDEGGPLAHRNLGIPPEVAKDFIAELMRSEALRCKRRKILAVNARREREGKTFDNFHVFGLPKAFPFDA